MERKHLSAVANDVLRKCSQKLDTSVDSLIEEFERGWTPEAGDYTKKLVEFSSCKTLSVSCGAIGETISDGSFSRATFDMMLAWEVPSLQDEESYAECVAKEREEKKFSVISDQIQEDVPLFYSDILPLLVDQGPSAGEDAFVWLSSLVPLAADTVNARFTFDTLTAPTANRLHFPAYDKFFKEIQRCVKHLQKQETPKGVELADDEFILHVEGTAGSQRVIRHIGGTSWPGRLTLTNYALYFEASSVLSYDDALKLDLSKKIEHNVKTASTGPWGAPLFDKAVVYESPELQEGVVIEFPELTSSTRRDHWLALIKEIMLLHRFLSKSEVNSPLQVWEVHSRTILGIIRLHAAREMLRISPPEPKSFLIFALMDELPKGDYVLQELAESLKSSTTGHPCSASSILRNLNVSAQCIPCMEPENIQEAVVQPENIASLESAVNKSREEARDMDMAKATAEGFREEGVSESAQVLMGLIRPLKDAILSTRRIFTWDRPVTSTAVIVTVLLIIYREWIGKAISACLLFLVATMIGARKRNIPERLDRIIILKEPSNQSTVESVVSAQQTIITVHETMQKTNIALLKLWSILVSKAPKHTDAVIAITTCCAVALAVVPFKFVLMGGVVYCFSSKRMQKSEEGSRRLREWWDSIPVMAVEVVEKKRE